MSSISLGVVAALLLAAVGCDHAYGEADLTWSGDASVDELEGDSAFDYVHGGAPTAGPAGVGVLFGSLVCTATLVAPDWALTSAHCVGFGSERTVPASRNWTLRLGANLRDEYRIVRTVSFGRSTFRDDIAVVQLDRAPPRALRLRIDARAPRDGEELRLVGVGDSQCPGFTPTHSWGRRRQATITWGRSSTRVCHSDSGAPLFRGRHVVAVATGRGIELLANGTTRSRDAFIPLAGFDERIRDATQAR